MADPLYEEWVRTREERRQALALVALMLEEWDKQCGLFQEAMGNLRSAMREARDTIDRIVTMFPKPDA